MYVNALEGVTPAPWNPHFAEHSGARIEYSIRLMQKYLRPADRVMDLASGAHFSYVVTRALPHIGWMPTDGQSTPEVLTKAGDRYSYEPIPFLFDADTRTLPQTDLDAVTLFEVVEHLAFNPAKLFGGINEALKDGGLFILSTPNIGSRIAIWRELHGGAPYQIHFFEPGYWSHKREYAPWELRELVRWAGFEIVSHTTRDIAKRERLTPRSFISYAALLAAAALSFDLGAMRQLTQFAGSTQFLVCRKVRAPKWNEKPHAV